MGEVMGCSGSGTHHRWALGGRQDGGWGGGRCDRSASRAPWPSSRVVEAGASLGGEERTWLIHAPGVGEGEPWSCPQMGAFHTVGKVAAGHPSPHPESCACPISGSFAYPKVLKITSCFF